MIPHGSSHSVLDQCQASGGILRCPPNINRMCLLDDNRLACNAVGCERETQVCPVAISKEHWEQGKSFMVLFALTKNNLNTFRSKRPDFSSSWRSAQSAPLSGGSNGNVGNCTIKCHLKIIRVKCDHRSVIQKSLKCLSISPRRAPSRSIIKGHRHFRRVEARISWRRVQRVHT